MLRLRLEWLGLADKRLSWLGYLLSYLRDLGTNSWSIKGKPKIDRCGIVCNWRLLNELWLYLGLLNSLRFDSLPSSEEIIIEDIGIRLWLIDDLLFSNWLWSRLDQLRSDALERFLIVDNGLLFLLLFNYWSHCRTSWLFCSCGSRKRLVVLVLVQGWFGRAVIPINAQSALIERWGWTETAGLVWLVINAAVFRVAGASTIVASEASVVASSNNSTHSFSDGFGFESLFLKQLLVAEQVNNDFGPFLDWFTPVDTVLVMWEAIEWSELVNVIFEGWNDTGRTIFKQKLHQTECLEDLFPAFSFL